MPKSKDAFRTISEVAEWLETPAHVLRFWESKFTQVKPIKRAGGRRYYRPADMQLLGGIKKLLHDDGLTIKGAQKLLREHGVKHVASLSQLLDEDLLDDDSLIQEAAYEPDAQPDPIVEEPARVLTFPSRADTKPAPEPAPTSEPEPKIEHDPETAIAQEPQNPAPPRADLFEPETPLETPEVAEISGDDTSPDRAGDAPAFGSDALPAFLRRSPAQPPQTSDNLEAEEPDAPEENATPESAVEKVTINPTAHFEPVFSDDEAQAEAAVPQSREEAATAEPEPADPAPQPMFSHSTRAPDARVEDAPQGDVEPEPQEPAAARDQDIESPPARPAIDIPSVAKIAPALESYAADAGVLAALPGARRVSSELAGELAARLKDLRALRDRMQSH